jgi:hypothetical protein
MYYFFTKERIMVPGFYCALQFINHNHINNGVVIRILEMNSNSVVNGFMVICVSFLTVISIMHIGN